MSTEMSVSDATAAGGAGAGAGGLSPIENFDDGVKKYTTFDEMDIPMHILRGIYNYGYEKPSPIQQKGIVPMVKGHDIIGHAQSGTGKTGTFVIGSISHVDISKNQVQVLVLEPVRELARQTARVASKIGEFMGLKVHCATGGPPVIDDIRQIEKGIHFLVGTPGRIYDLLDRKVFNPKDIKVIILDEADQMLEARFKEQVLSILNMGFSKSVLVGLFSATMPDGIREIADSMCIDPVKILLPPEKVTLEGIRQYYIKFDDDKQKLGTLIDLYENLRITQAIIYVRTRIRAEWLAEQMKALKFKIECIHGDMSDGERNERMECFITGSSRILIATDMLARGIDIQQISTVINYELPDDRENYIHRIGRTGRFGRKGVSINLITNREAAQQKEIEVHYKTTIMELPCDLKSI